MSDPGNEAKDQACELNFLCAIGGQAGVGTVEMNECFKMSQEGSRVSSLRVISLTYEDLFWAAAFIWRDGSLNCRKSFHLKKLACEVKQHVRTANGTHA